jgi:hypothetical protein
MATSSEKKITETFLSSGDHSTKQYHFVEHGASGVSPCNAIGEGCIGVNTGKPKVAGEATPVDIYGLVAVKAGAAFAVGDKLTTDAAGKAISTVTTGHYVHAIAIEAATAADQIVTVLLGHYGKL